jgi:eukaryotic-like serine/threonine-protein kinase
MTNTMWAAKDSLIGTVLLGRYRIVRELAKGGMGVVYLARAEGAVGFVKPVVVKLILPEHASDRRFVGMFAREAQILAQLRHPSIVAVTEFGEQDGAYVMVLEYVRGYHLGQWARYLKLKGRRLPPDLALQLTIDVLDALHHAHSMAHPDGASMHIVHRDVSPSNILLDEDGRARLLDFGVARMRGDEVDYQTQVKGFVGKLIYSAPEVFIEGESTPKSDVYACAVVLHEILFGKNVFRGENQAKTLHNALHHMPESVESLSEDVPRGLDAVLARALAKKPEERFESARAFANGLRALQTASESDIRGKLSALLKVDFGREMAEFLGLESLVDRDIAWRRLNAQTSDELAIEVPADAERVQPGTSLTSGVRTTREKLAPSLPPPPANQNDRGLTTGGRAPIPPPPLPRAIAPLPEPARVKPPLPMPVLAASVVMVGLAAAAFLYAQKSEPTPMRHAQISVVQTARDPAPSVAAETPQDGPEVEAIPPIPEKLATGARTRPRGPDPEALTRAFRRQEGAMTGCFARHAVSVEGMPVVKLTFDLQADGKLVSVHVTPASLAQTALGQCIKKVASDTRFPAQGKPVSFAIPLSASRGRGT